MRFLHFIVHSNVFISLSAVALALATQIQLGLEPHIHPYLFLVFFATFFEYNFHRLITIVKNPIALQTEKYKWVNKNKSLFYILMSLSAIGFVLFALMAKKEVLMALSPIALITLLYSLPATKTIFNNLRLRRIPYVKIFLIAIVWTAVTVIIPVIHADKHFLPSTVFLMLFERFLFILAITIPFDIRDMEADRNAGLKTIPLTIGYKNALLLSNALLCLFGALSIAHYAHEQQFHVLFALLFSTIITGVVLINKKLQHNELYHYFYLDGMMFVQGLLVFVSFYLNDSLTYF